MDFKQVLRSLIASVLAILIASNTASGIHYNSVEALVVAIVLLSIFNIFLKPLLMLFSLPFIVLTFGLGICIINAALFLLVAAMVNGFYVESFVSALWGAFVLSIINLISTIYFGNPRNRQFTIKINRSSQSNQNVNLDRFGQRSKISRQPRDSIKGDDVIDV